MQRITVHITDETKQRIDLAAKALEQVEAELIRKAIDTGLNAIYPKNSSAKSLVELAKMAKGFPYHPNEPTYISGDTAKYAFGNGNE